MSDYSDLFNPTDHRDDLPQRVHGFLRLCELACCWHEWQEKHADEPKAWFCDGVLDYWYGDGLIEPSFEQLFHKPLFDEELRGWPSHRRFCYQQGAIVGYRLNEEYGQSE